MRSPLRMRWEVIAVLTHDMTGKRIDMPLEITPTRFRTYRAAMHTAARRQFDNPQLLGVGIPIDWVVRRIVEPRVIR